MRELVVLFLMCGFFSTCSIASTTLGHTAIAASDLDKSISWYKNVLGAKLLEIKSADEESNPGLLGIAKALFGSDVESMRFAKMKFENGVGLEIFEFLKPRSLELNPDEYNKFRKRGGVHFALVSDNVLALKDSIRSHGGHVLVEGNANFAFCSDPDGNIIELSAHSW